MKISYNWLKDYADISDLDVPRVGEILTSTGLEVEGIEKFESVKGGLKGIIIGEVKTCQKHPDADRLSITTVDIGKGKILPIVCGAPNVAAGQKVLVATEGTKLYMNDKEFVIKKTSIRGAESEGMICAEDEVGLGNSHEGIMVLDPDTRIGMEAKDYFNVEEDWVYEIGLTPNRTDATAHIGVARDLVAALNQQEKRDLTLKKPDVENFAPDNHDFTIDIEIDDPVACPRYTGLTITGIEVKESPLWLKNRLNSVGIRPINNIVDITNFVLLETGHPLHAFDASQVKGNKIIIRKAGDGEKFVTLDEVERELTPDDLMICNVDNPMCIAGVFGGALSGVTEKTKDLFLESAYFDPGSIRKTSKYHNLQTDASFRFERGADPNMTVYAIKRAALLIKEIAGGQISGPVIDVYPEPVEPWHVILKLDNLKVLAGQTIDKEVIKKILYDLEIKINTEDEEGFELLVPNYRHDVRREADVIEEILRIYGYNNIEIGEKLNTSLSFYPNPDPDEIMGNIADYLSSNGFREIMNNSLTKASYTSIVPGFNAADNVKILNPLSNDLNVLRQSLIFGGLESVIFNLNRKNNNLRFYEFGYVYKLNPSENNQEELLKKYSEHLHLSLFLTGDKYLESWNTSGESMDFFTLKNYIHQILYKLGIDQGRINYENCQLPIFEQGIQYSIDKEIIIYAGVLSGRVLNTFDIKQDVYYADILWEKILKNIPSTGITYQPVPKYPAVRRDLALLIDRETTFDDIEKLVRKAEPGLIRSVDLFDVFEGDKLEKGKKSYAISIIMQDPGKTLTDKIVDKVMNKVMGSLKQNLNASIR